MAQWTITSAPETYPVTSQQVADQTHMDNLTAEAAWVSEAIADATAYAETECQLSLITREITAVYYPEKSNVLPQANPFVPYSCLPLFRPPVQTVSSVTDGAGNAVSYQMRNAGTQDFVQLISSVIGPVTIVYTAGYGDTAATVPADIRRAILAHASHMWRYREADSDSIPTGLAYIYDRYRTGGSAG